MTPSPPPPLPTTLPPLRGYYAILDLGAARSAERAPLLATAADLLAARPCRLQLRAKQTPAAELAAVGRLLLPLTRAAGVPLCINDRLDVALAIGAESIHLGQDDLPIRDARQLAGTRLEIGVSTHNLDQVVAASQGGADYLGYGPVFATGTKANPDPVVGLDGLAAAVGATTLPIVAIGGITLANLPEVVATGVASAALIGAVLAAPDRRAAATAASRAWPLPA
jgi:thiamine-phosphate pyrophosphorylase